MIEKNYEQILNELKYLLADMKFDVSILSNAAALLNMHMDDINWLGFYLIKDDMLILGPFQGKPACSLIPLNKGVCGTCATSQKTIIVKNVEDFKGHIVCDAASKSEICIPIFKNHKIYGLLDIDSPVLNRFTEIDQLYLEKIVKIIENALLYAD